MELRVKRRHPIRGTLTAAQIPNLQTLFDLRAAAGAVRSLTAAPPPPKAGLPWPHFGHRMATNVV